MVPEGMFDLVGASIIGYSPKAVKVTADDLGDTEDTFLWIPKSLIHDDSEMPYAPDVDVMFIAEWWAELKGLL